MAVLLRVLPLFIFFCSFSAEAAKIMKIKGKKVYIIFNQDEPFAANDIFTIKSPSGKSTGIVQIKKIKGRKAIGLLKKGKAIKGDTADFKSAGKAPKAEVADTESEESSSSSTSSDRRGPRIGTYSRWGLMFGYGAAKQDVNQGVASTSAQSGSSLAIRGIYDLPVLDTVSFRLGAGTEIFSVSGDGVPVTGGSNTTIGTDITYMAVDALLNWGFVQNESFRMYLQGGLGILYPLSKKSDAILIDSVESLAIGEMGLGFEFNVGSWWIPMDVTYYYFPSGEDVKTNVISVKVGFLF